MRAAQSTNTSGLASSAAESSRGMKPARRRPASSMPGASMPCLAATASRSDRPSLTGLGDSRSATRPRIGPALAPGPSDRADFPPELLLQVVLELAAPARVTQLAQRLRLDLADALAGHVELLAHFLEGTS